jgi:hypothetical protein
MAQSSREVTTVFIPEPGLNVQTAASEEWPGGRVVHYNPGYAEIPVSDASNLFLTPESEEENKRRLAMLEADKARTEAISASLTDYYTKATEVDEAALTAMRGEEEARAKRIEADAAKGIVRSEPHPDKQAQASISITAGPEYHMVSAAGMSAKYAPEGSPAHAPPATTPPPAQTRENGAPRRTTV